MRCTGKFGYGMEARPAVKRTVSEAGGSRGVETPVLPANSSLEFEVTLCEHIDFNDARSIVSDSKGGADSTAVVASSSEVVRERDVTWRECLLRKECGTRWYVYGDYVRAGRAYAKGAEGAEKFLKSAAASVNDDEVV